MPNINDVNAAKWQGWPMAITPPTVEVMLEELYLNLKADALDPFYKEYLKRHLKLAKLCVDISKGKVKTPEYHYGELEVAYRDLLEEMDLPDVVYGGFEEMESLSLKFKRFVR